MNLEPMTDRQETQAGNAAQEMSSSAEERVNTAAASGCELFEGGLGI